jgi:hypothetical protein
MTFYLDLTPSQLMDVMEGRPDADDYRMTVWGHGGIDIVHIPTGLRAYSSDESLTRFENKRAAWAMLMAKIQAVSDE